MDLSSGVREFADIDEIDNEDESYKALTLKDKVIYQIKNW
jgi:hypothetical protein